MRTRRISIGIITALLAASLAASARADLGGPSIPAAPAAPLAQNGSAFTYQGQLRKNGAPVNASCNASFGLFDAETGGVQVGGTVTSPTLQVANGLFTIALDFGWNFNGEARWLDTAIGCGEAQTTLTPRTALRPAPYAFALPGMRTIPGNSDVGGNPTMNVIGGVVSGAISNTISADSYNSAIGGGHRNLINNGSYVSAIGGGYFNRINNNSTWSVIGGGYSHLISGTTFSAIAGGYDNRIDNASAYGAIGGGYDNRIDNASAYGAIGGGESNRILNSSARSAIGGGHSNSIDNGSSWSAIGGGDNNRIDYGSDYGAISGGDSNSIDNGSSWSAIGGGDRNVITSAIRAVIPGGYSNRVEGNYGFAAGNRAKALHNGTFVWGDSSGADIASTAANQFIVRAAGKVGITSYANQISPNAQLHVETNDLYVLALKSSNSIGTWAELSNSTSGGATWSLISTGSSNVHGAGKFLLYNQGAIMTMANANQKILMSDGANETSGVWTNSSDRNLKANFTPVDGRAVLAQIAGLPLSTWNYKTDDPAIRHIGPMAQDFYATFKIGNDDTHIGTVDTAGVAFAAIQGLYQVVQEKDQRITQLEQEMAQVKKGANPEPGVNLFNLVSLLALGGVIVVGLRQRRGGRA